MSVRTAPRRGAPGALATLALVALLPLSGCGARSTAPPGFPPAAPSSEPSPPPESEPEAKSDPTLVRAIGWFSVAIGTEGAIVAATTSAIMLHEKSRRDSNCNAEKQCSPDGIDANNQIGSLSAWNAGAWVVGAAGLGVGTFLLVTHPANDAPRAAVTLHPGGALAGLGLSGSF
jgi:hypothetical protein